MNRTRSSTRGFEIPISDRQKKGRKGKKITRENEYLHETCLELIEKD